MITLRSHYLLPNGRTVVVLFIEGVERGDLPHVAAELAVAPGGMTATWSWGPGMAPTDPVTACIEHVRGPLLADALAWYGGPIDLTA